MISLRNLFSKYRISWIDHGPNCSRPNINIQCPFCGNSDRSRHMSVNEELGYYFCFRNPRHKGQNVIVLLKKLNIPADEYGGLKFEKEDPSAYEDKRNYSEWNYFEAADESEEALAYLRSRLFEDPCAIAQRFDLRVSKEGIWAGRLIIPLTIGWTGRAMRSHLELRYRAHTSEDGFFLFKQRSSSCIIVEGAIDAIRIASVSSQFDVIGKCRIEISAAILAYLREANYSSIYNSPDGKVPYSQYRAETATIRSYCTQTTVSQFLLPEGRKDFGATPENETRRLLTSLGAERMVSYG